VKWLPAPAAKCRVVDKRVGPGHEETMTLEQQLREAARKAFKNGTNSRVEETDVRLADLEMKASQLDEYLGDVTRKFANARTSLHGGSNLRGAIPKAYQDQIQPAEYIMRAQKVDADRERRRSFCADDPELKVAVGAYFRGHLLKLTRPGDFYAQAAEHEKLVEALGGVPIQKAAMSELSAGVGGNLVPTIVESEILRLIVDNGVLRRAGCRQVPMTSRLHAYPTRNAAFTAAIIAEEGSITDSVPATPFAQSALTAKKIAAFATVSGELMQDNVVLLADFLATEFGQQIALTEDTQALEGDGTGVNFTGLVAAAGVNSVTSGANGDALSYQKLVDAIFGSGQSSAIDSTSLFMAQKLVSSLYKSRSGAASATDQGGVPLFAPAAGIMVAPSQGILGHPFYGHSGILINRAVGTGTNRTNLYAGPPQTIIFGDLLGFTVDLNPYAKFQTFQIDIRGVKRTGILVAVPTAWTKYTAIDPLLTMAV
jgi:HK97 family phage major capsid protein